VVDGLTFYSSVVVNGKKVAMGGHVTIEANEPNKPTYIAEVVALFQDGKTGEQLFHARWFARPTETVLGETCDDPKELIVGDDCEDVLLSAVVQVIRVELRIPDPVKWKEQGGSEEAVVHPEADGDAPYWYRYLYRVSFTFSFFIKI